MNESFKYKDIIKLKRTENIYLVVDALNKNKSKHFQLKGHCYRKLMKVFKLTLLQFKILL